MTDEANVELLRRLSEYATEIQMALRDLAEAQDGRDEVITDALKAGIPAATVARFAGLTPGRVSQLRKDDNEQR